MHLNIGAHVSTSAGRSRSLQTLASLGGTSMQIFATSPQTWKPAQVSDEDASLFRKTKKDNGVDPVVFHASYLINLADNGTTGDKSVQTLIHELSLQPRMGVSGSVVHVGSYKKPKKTVAGLFDTDENAAKYTILISRIKEILRHTPLESTFVIENDATRKICQNIDTIASIIHDIGSDRLKVCLDTCHLHAAGYNLADQKEYERFIDNFDRIIGLNRLSVIHLNDSKDDFGSMRDRHDNLGDGKVGVSTFRNLLNDPRLRSIPFILEVPGLDGNGPDKENIDRARSYVSTV